ncbi:MAG: FkbM family methyltransferase [Patescibacteria group bacterium]
MEQIILRIYRFIFLHKIFYKLNYHIYRISLRGIGILNSEGPDVSGENYFLRKLRKYSILKNILDVGANDGGYSQQLRMYFPKAKIYAIEPHPQTFKRLKAVTKKNNIHAYNIGLGSTIGTSYLWDFADDAELKHTQPTSTLASGIKDVIEELHKQKSKSYKFRMDTLDNFAKKQKIKKIDFLKIDVEGNELAVLQGAVDLLKTNRILFIQLEFNEMNAYSRTFFKDFIDTLPDYIFYRIMPRGLYKLDSYRPSSYEIFAFQNIIAVHKSMGSVIRKF